ncbi:nuclear transport factor 2 family protein [Streptomyces sp. NPDC098781]|uniref:nuclear transport factor 2 family protein n=1 Tax=Streptomyces sp. NPDC098781 TaxID=3366097 RepID=UPI0037F724DE
MISEMSPHKCLAQFAAAWAERDVAGLLDLMTDDAVYAASVGPEPGRTFRGHHELAGGFRAMFEHDADAVIEQDEPVVKGDWAVSTWTYRFVVADGPQRCERGIDLWRFRQGKICLKDAYRKVHG